MKKSNKSGLKMLCWIFVLALPFFNLIMRRPDVAFPRGLMLLLFALAALGVVGLLLLRSVKVED